MLNLSPAMANYCRYIEIMLMNLDDDFRPRLHRILSRYLQAVCRSILSLLAESFQLSSLAIEFGLVTIDLPLLVRLSLILTLKLIANQNA
jgi:hypothetical protein